MFLPSTLYRTWFWGLWVSYFFDICILYIYISSRLTPQEKQELLKEFVSNGENLKAVETHLTVTREESGTVEHRKELLTIAEMRSRGFSQCLCWHKICFWGKG